MNIKIKKLQERYQRGELTKDQYLEQLNALLETEEIDKDDHDEAAEFDPNAERLIYSQADVDRMLKPKALQLVKKALKDANVELPDGTTNKTLLAELAKLAAAGTGKQAPTADEKELKALRDAAAKAGRMEGDLKRLTMENAILKASGKYQPHNSAQVVRALADYDDLLEYDDEGAIVPRSVDKALKRIAQVEPNLFKNPEGKADDGADEQNNGGGFRGKQPGGAGGGGSNAGKEEENLQTMRQMLGIKDQK